MRDFFFNSISYLALVDPDAQKNIENVIGNKMDRLVTLHGLCAGMFFRSVFQIEESPEGTAALVVLALAKQKSGTIDLDAVSTELERLKEGLDQFRSVIMGCFDKEELRPLTDEARKATQIGGAGA